jgi:hypothetical protein
MHASGMVLESLVGDPASHGIPSLVRHQKTNAVLF